MIYKIPKEVLKVLDRLDSKGFGAYLIGGCVRDLLLDIVPKDWDITSSAKPEEIQELFDNTFYENDFGTVGVVTDSEDPTTKVVEVTPYRREAKYTDKRHPDIVKFSEKLEDDLQRRDFTINALALGVHQAAYVEPSFALRTGEVDEKLIKIIDLWKGKDDLKKKIIRAVGDPVERFGEDALRILRAVRLATELKFNIEKETKSAIKEQAHLLRVVSKERIRDEFNKMIMSDNPSHGFREMQKLELLKYIVPEIAESVGVTQNKEHIFTVWEHSIRALDHAAKRKFSLEVRLATFFHDVGKPRTKRGEGPDSTFYNHEVVGARMTTRILARLKYPKKLIEKVAGLVRWHLFFSDTEIITLSAVRRVIRNIGKENIWDLMSVRFCDRIGMGRPKEQPYRLRKYEAMVEEAMRDPLHVKNLKVSGEDVMKVADIKPSPKIGFILHALLEEVLDDPSLNKKDYLEKRTKELAKMSGKEMEDLGKAGKKRKELEEGKEVGQIRKKYGVK